MLCYFYSVFFRWCNIVLRLRLLPVPPLCSGGRFRLWCRPPSCFLFPVFSSNINARSVLFLFSPNPSWCTSSYILKHAQGVLFPKSLYSWMSFRRRPIVDHNDCVVHSCPFGSQRERTHPRCRHSAKYWRPSWKVSSFRGVVVPYEAHEYLRSHRVWTSPESCEFGRSPYLNYRTNIWLRQS